MSNLIGVSSNEEYEKLSQKGIVLVDFWAEWCGPCRQMMPIIEKLAEENKDITFLKVNVDEPSDLAAKYGVRSIPQISILKDSEISETKIGQTPPNIIQEIINNVKND